MMTPKEVVNIVLAEPFRPFRINMASGKTYEIRHPEIVQVGKSNLTIFTPLLDDEDAEGNQLWKKISLMFIESIEPLDVAVDSNRNKD